MTSFLLKDTVAPSCLPNLKSFACEQLFFSDAQSFCPIHCHLVCFSVGALMFCVTNAFWGCTAPLLKSLVCCSAVFPPITDLAQVCHQQCLLMVPKVFHFTLPVFSSSSSSHSSPHCEDSIFEGCKTWILFLLQMRPTPLCTKICLLQIHLQFSSGRKVVQRTFQHQEKLEWRIPNTTLNHTIVAQS